MNKTYTIYWRDGHKSFVKAETFQAAFPVNSKPVFAVFEEANDNYFFTTQYGWQRRRDEVLISIEEVKKDRQAITEKIKSQLQKHIDINVVFENKNRLAIELTSHWVECYKTAILVHQLEYDPTSGYPVETDSGPCFYVTNTQSFDPINDVDLAIKYFLDVAEGKEVLKEPGRQCIDLCDPPAGTTAYVVS